MARERFSTYLNLHNFIVFFWSLSVCMCIKLDTVSDEELLNHIRTDKYVIVLFSKSDCEQCDDLETNLAAIRGDLVDSLDAWVIKVIDSPLVKLYSPDLEPAVVFFRHGIAMLYSGSGNEDEMLDMLLQSREPAVKELTDDSFEHLTQASTGATTGDWFVMFYHTYCDKSKKLQARWEAVAAQLKRRMNVARVNKHTSGGATARRFGVTDTPTFILFRLGNLYRYDIPTWEFASFIGFSQGWYKNMPAEPVPMPKAPFDDFVEMIVEFIRENLFLVKIVSILVSVMIVLIAVKLRSGREEEKED